jgi:flagellar hook-associated protein 3 FlgL
MRVSTSMIYDQGTANLNRQTAAFLKVQNQLATGRRMINPSDDPVAAARALEVTQSRDMNSQFLDNQNAARDALRTTEISLTSLGDLLQNVRESAIRAGNGSLDDSQRGMIATELRQQFSQLLSIANARDANGEFMFAGFGLAAGETQAYEGSVEAGVTANGDQGQRKLQVSAARQLTISNSGFEVFENVDRVGGGKQSVFDTVRNLITALETPGASTTGAALPVALGNIDQALDNALRVRADVGARSAELDALENAGTALDVQYQSTLSVLQDLDYNVAITNSAKLQTALTAAQKTFMQASQLSLFNYL